LGWLILKGRWKKRSKMKIPQKKQKDESQEEYVRRISKFPALNPDTIQRVVFPASNKVSWHCLHNWAGLVFPEEFPQPDLDGYPDLYPKDISTKAFAKWVAEECMSSNESGTKFGFS
jgi:hypothetical protein